MKYRMSKDERDFFKWLFVTALTFSVMATLVVLAIR